MVGRRSLSRAITGLTGRICQKNVITDEEKEEWVLKWANSGVRWMGQPGRLHAKLAAHEKFASSAWQPAHEAG